ncbi:hypothetical protein F503_05116 [Ophiostoma piceae UAMH 11346]|uniref:Cytochrome b561 domain-containing protein n=1 Tax=Ophiostoma piceae (strain UAMH 11346) TaxID=1262450 RepID=S3CDC7_OPHP1|nr:hypothetical protein F503_05116 [Ophiostoma piceae UAMH 11346]
MAPADQLAPAGSSSYTSDTLNVGDGTWDFTKNDFLLPNLVGLDFETMRYNGMGNRFSTIPQYHSLIKGHGAVAVITFLFIIPISGMIARFYNRRSGYAMRYHTYLNIVAGLLSTVVLITGWFAVGPNRSLTNPHHGIGIAIYTLVLVQIIGGRLVRHLAGRHSLRLTIHRWFGRAIALLGIVQVPLGLTLYGSPKVLFILFSLWMAFLFFVYFILSYRHEGRRDRDVFDEGHSEAPAASSGGGGGMLRWLGPLAAGAGAWALLRGRHKNKERSPSRSRRDSRSRVESRSRSRSRSYYTRTDMQSSRRESDSFIEDEKVRPNRKNSSGGGLMDKLFAAGAVAGAGALLTSFMSNRKKKNRDEEYSAVATDTPSRPPPGRLSRPPPRRNTVPLSEVSYSTEETRTDLPGSPTPGPRRHHGSSSAAAAGAAAGVAAAAAIGNSYRNGSYRSERPITPRPSHQRAHSIQDHTVDGSDYSSYRSPSRRSPPASSRAAPAGKGFLGGMGLSWIANRFSRRPEADDIERRRREEEDRRTGSRYTGDGYGSPVRRDRRQRPPPPSLPSEVTQTYSDISDSVVEPSLTSAHPSSAPPPAGGSLQPGYPVTPGANTRQSRSSILRSRQDIEPITMPEMPPLSDSDSILPAQRRRSESRRRAEAEGLAAGAAAAGAAGRSSSRRPSEDGRSSTYPPQSNQPSATVKLKVHDDRGGNITLRRFTEAEAAAERERTGRGSSQQRRPNPAVDSVSSLSGTESPSNRRYRRDSSVRPSEAAERKSGSLQPTAPYQAAPPSSSNVLNPPNPPFAGGRRPKDSAYYSGGQGAPGPSGSNPAAGHTMTSLESPGSHGTWSAMSPSPAAGASSTRPPDVSSNAAAERRRRRRMERSDTGRQPKVDY